MSTIKTSTNIPEHLKGALFTGKVNQTPNHLLDTLPVPDLSAPPQTEQPAQSNYMAAIGEQAARHEEEYKNSVTAWNKLYSDLLAEKDNLYKADPRLAETKRKEAGLKTLVSAFGSLADTAAVAFGGTAPLRDYRANISQTHQQADALDQSERAKESAAYQKYLDRLEKAWDKRPKWTKNDAALLQARLFAEEHKINLNGANQLARQKDQQQFTAGENKRKIEAADKRTNAQIEARKNGKKEKDPYSEILIDLNDGKGERNIPLSKGEFAKLAFIIEKEKGWNRNEGTTRNDPDFNLLKASMGDGSINKMTWEKFFAKYHDLVLDAVYKMKYGESHNVPAVTNPIAQPADTTQNKKTYKGVPKI